MWTHQEVSLLNRAYLLMPWLTQCYWYIWSQPGLNLRQLSLSTQWDMSPNKILQITKKSAEHAWHGVTRLWYCIARRCIAMNGVVLHGVSLHCMVCHCIAWNCVVWCCMAWWSWCCMVWQRIALHRLYGVALYVMVWHSIAWFAVLFVHEHCCWDSRFGVLPRRAITLFTYLSYMLVMAFFSAYFIWY